MSSREEFEKTMAPLFEENLGMNPDPSVWHKNKNGSYLNPVLEQHFVTWQAATALQAERVRDLEEALRDMLSGWRYIREAHGDLYGVGWDRAQEKAEQALSATAREVGE